MKISIIMTLKSMFNWTSLRIVFCRLRFVIAFRLVLNHPRCFLLWRMCPGHSFFSFFTTKTYEIHFYFISKVINANAEYIRFVSDACNSRGNTKATLKQNGMERISRITVISMVLYNGIYNISIQKLNVWYTITFHVFLEEVFSILLCLK